MLFPDLGSSLHLWHQILILIPIGSSSKFPNTNVVIIQHFHEQKPPPNPSMPPGNHKNPWAHRKTNFQQTTKHTLAAARDQGTKQALPVPPWPCWAKPSHAMPWEMPCSRFAPQLPGKLKLLWESRWSCGITDSMWEWEWWDTGQHTLRVPRSNGCTVTHEWARMATGETAHHLHKDMEMLCCLPLLCNQYFIIGN